LAKNRRESPFSSWDASRIGARRVSLGELAAEWVCRVASSVVRR
jgi:hypothetical protein